MEIVKKFGQRGQKKRNLFLRRSASRGVLMESPWEEARLEKGCGFHVGTLAWCRKERRAGLGPLSGDWSDIHIDMLPCGTWWEKAPIKNSVFKIRQVQFDLSVRTQSWRSTDVYWEPTTTCPGHWLYQRENKQTPLFPFTQGIYIPETEVKRKP